MCKTRRNGCSALSSIRVVAQGPLVVKPASAAMSSSSASKSEQKEHARKKGKLTKFGRGTFNQHSQKHTFRHALGERLEEGFPFAFLLYHDADENSEDSSNYGHNLTAA